MIRNDLKYETKDYSHKFFVDSIYTRQINIVEAEENQSNLLSNIVAFNNKCGPGWKEDRDKKRNTHKSAYALYKGRELTLNAFKSGILILNSTQGKRVKILSHNQ